MNKRQNYNNHKEWTRGWQYKKDAPYDLEWNKDKKKLCALNGNGWWWGWTHDNCPIEELKPHLKHLYDLREIERLKEKKEVVQFKCPLWHPF